MSRLEQMRAHFLQRVYNEQEVSTNTVKNHYQQKSVARTLSSAKSVAHLPSSRDYHNNSYQNQNYQKISSNQNYHHHYQMRRTPSCLTSSSTSGLRARIDRRNSSSSSCSSSSNLSRVKSLTSIHQQNLEPYRVQPAKVSKVYKQNVEHFPQTKGIQTSEGPSSKVNNSTVSKVNKASQQATITSSSKVSNTSFRENRRPSTNGNSSSLGTRGSQAEQPKLECKHCGRSFAAKERLDKHVTICEKTSSKKRPVFSSARQREVLLTDKADENNDKEKKASSSDDRLLNDILTSTLNSNNKKVNQNVEKSPTKSANWEESRRQFLAAVRKAKQPKSETEMVDIKVVEIKVKPKPQKLEKENKPELEKITTSVSNALINFDDITTTENYHKPEEDSFDNSAFSSSASSTSSSTNPAILTSGPADDDIFKYCSYCKRSFGVHVIIRHETICGKLFRKKHFNVLN